MKNIKVYDPRDFPDYLPQLNHLYDDLFAGGKAFRALLTEKVAAALPLTTKNTHLLCQTIEFIHNASLLHDDLVDRASLRRNKTAAWLKYTPEYAVLAGDYLLARVMVNLSSHGNVQLISLTSQTISDLLEGEWLQDGLVGRRDISLVDLDRVHELKTASLFRWCLRAPFVMAERYDEELHEVLHELGRLLGLLFQRSDDLLDFDVRNYERKAVLGDLQAGYFNSVAAFALARLETEEKERILPEFARCENLRKVEEIYGRSSWQKALSEFDQMNQEIQAHYDQQLSQLESYLSGSEYCHLKKALQPLGRYLYWRRK